ncbi:MAG TPA: glycine cleavage system protein GcvH [Dongiaceae bacterium]|jgi:glycine cleavage system H protein
MSNVKFTEDHEWIRIEGDTGTIGITDYAQEQLGDVVYVELPDVGRKVEKGKDMAVVESVKAASEVYAPVSGSVTAINDKLTAEPATVNSAAMGDGWFVKIKLSNPSELDKLMDEAAYKKYVEGLG